ncbi:amidohydrolase family protein [Mycolicibacterium septicum]|uniref:amidohydrolase family protein n=1 Tax=Mycolicibacterium septicum TaxID=98668 RepID=UPI002361F1B3|nr:amidohydrolase family protein [Mycolicibacterium septicum]
MEPLIIFSGDGHIGQPFGGYRDYIDPAYRDRLEDLAEVQEFFASVVFGSLGKMAPDVAQVVDERGVRGGLPDVFWDVEKRVAELDAEGIACELALADSSLAPFFSSLGDAYPPDLRSAGCRAFHRWAAEFLSAAGGRIVGNAEIYPDDIDGTVAELPRLAEQGFVSLTLPGANADPSLPTLESREYDPLWATCAELGLALNVHAGWGRPQGAAMQFMRALAPGKNMNMMQPEAASSAEESAELVDSLERLSKEKKIDAKNPDSPLALTLHPQQAIWRMILSGVFDRYPTLQLVLTEVRADWVPATMKYLDKRFAEHPRKCEMRPSEYFERHIAFTPSAPHRAEVEMLDQIGAAKVMFGADIPHPEGTWPNSRQWIDDAFKAVPEDKLRMVLGENAIRIYNLDRAKLAKIAAGLRVKPSDLFTGDVLDDRLLDHFDARAGYRRPADEIDREQIGRELDADFTRLANV